MGLVGQLPALLGVVIGAAASYTAATLAERSRWRRAQEVRWDERRLQALADYAFAVKDMVLIASRLAAAQGILPSAEPLAADAEGLNRLAEAEARRATLIETLRLLCDSDTMDAVRAMNVCAWRLEWLARGKLSGSEADWRKAYAAYKVARDEYVQCGRQSLQVVGSVAPISRSDFLPWQDPDGKQLPGPSELPD